MATADGTFSDFVHTRWAPLVRLAYPMTLDVQRAEDLVQDALVKLWFVWPRIREQNPDGYVRRIVVHLAISSRRRLWRREHPTSALPEERTGSDETSRIDDKVAVLAMLSHLSPRQRAVLVLRYLEDLSEQETADALGCSAGSVKQHTSRAMAKLRTSQPAGLNLAPAAITREG